MGSRVKSRMALVESTANFDPSTQKITCQGAWDLAHISELEASLQKITWPSSGQITLEGRDLTKMDSAGAWLLSKHIKKMQAQGVIVYFENFLKKYQTLLSIVEKENLQSQSNAAEAKKISLLNKVGNFTIIQLEEWCDFLAFTGRLTFEMLRILRKPLSFRWTALASVIDKTGFQALPIIGLLSFMIGVVLAYQMGVQLRNYGANVFIVDLLGLSILREFGPLITAIMVAGRTGSAFTAQLGIMKINQEIDALDTMGVTSSELLLLPRIIGLTIALPLLTMWADIFGVFGGMVMANNMLDIGFHNFLHRFEQEIPLRALLIGLGKAPVFALIISSIGCFEGMRVQGSADSVGKNTTRSVVLGIFFIIVVDAIFSIILSKLKL